MKILTYAASVADDAPEHLRCLAKILLPDGKLHPVACYAPSKTEARAKAEQFLTWEAETERKRREAGQRRVGAMRQARETRAGAA